MALHVDRSHDGRDPHKDHEGEKAIKESEKMLVGLRPRKVKLKILHIIKEKNHSFLAHEKHLKLYNDLIKSMYVDESVAKESHKRKRKDAGGSSSKKSKAQDSPHYKGEEPPIQSWFNELVDVEKEPDEHEFENGFVIIFGKLVKKIFNKDKITKEVVKGPTFELIKGMFKNSIELEYNMEQCHLAFTNKIDLNNPEVTKIKAAKYEDEGIEEMIPYLWSPTIQNYNRDVKQGIYN
nr:hypothetical protein [Tanacetum cinerariifolium]